MDHRKEDGDAHMVKGRLCPLRSDCANKTPLSCQHIYGSRKPRLAMSYDKEGGHGKLVLFFSCRLQDTPFVYALLTLCRNQLTNKS